ncbi:hypothetical protein Lal_00031875, partial [Lupinus albus]
FLKEDTKDSIKKSKYPKDKTTCHECGKVGHMRYTCPTYLKRIEHKNKEYSWNIKAKKAYIIWDALKEVSISTSTTEDEESSKLCLMAQNLFLPRNSNYDDSPTFDILYVAYVEMHEELKNLAKKYLNKKRLILEHEKEICEFQYFIDDLKLENETLDIICMLTLHNKIAKFTYSSHNLDNLLATSRIVGNRSGLGYMHANKRKSNMKQVIYAKMSHKKLPSCFYCGLHGHNSISYEVIMHGITS